MNLSSTFLATILSCTPHDRAAQNPHSVAALMAQETPEHRRKIVLALAPAAQSESRTLSRREELARAINTEPYKV